MRKIREHFYAVLKHWIVLMGGVAAVGISLFERFRGVTGIPYWIFLIVSAVCFFAAFHRAWLDKDKELLAKDNELQAALGSAPEIVLDWQCGKGNPLMLRNLRGCTAYHIQIKDVVIKDRCTAKFKEVPHLAEGDSAGVLPVVSDVFARPDTEKGKAIRNDFTHVLEAAYETWGRNFDPVRLQLFVDYEDRNGRRYATRCNVVFDRFNTTAITTCEPPRPVAT